MDEQTDWEAFACTGNILRYLDYRAGQNLEHPAGETEDGTSCNTGSCAERDPL